MALNAHCSHLGGCSRGFFCAGTLTCMSRKSPCDSRPKETSAASRREIWPPFCTRTAGLSPCAPSCSVVTSKRKTPLVKQKKAWRMHEWLFRQKGHILISRGRNVSNATNSAALRLLPASLLLLLFFLLFGGFICNVKHHFISPMRCRKAV